MTDINLDYSSVLRRLFVAGVVVLFVGMAGLLFARPATAADDGAWDWLVADSPGDIANPSFSGGISDDGQVIVTTVDVSAPGDAYGPNAQHEIRISRDGGGTWASTSLPLGQTATRVSVSASGQDIGIYGTTNPSGTWMMLSADAGVTFAAAAGTLPDDSFSPSMTEFFVRPGKIFLAPTRYEFDGTDYAYFIDLYVSTDNGTSWSLQVTRPYDVNGSRLGISADGQRFIVGESAGISYSANDGSSWTDIPLSSIDPALDPAAVISYGAVISDDGQSLLTSYLDVTNDTFATYVSRDAGATWQKHANVLLPAIYGNSPVSRDFNTFIAIDTADLDLTDPDLTMSLIITRDGGTTWERLDDYVTFDNYASGIPILSGNGRTVFIADRNGDGNTLRLHAGHWTPVAVVDDGADEERSEGVQDVTAPSSPTPLAPDAGVAPGSLAVLMTSLGAIGILLISGIWMVLKARVIKSST